MSRFARLFLWAIALLALAGIAVVLFNDDGSQDASDAVQAFLVTFASSLATLFLLEWFDRPYHG